MWFLKVDSLFGLTIPTINPNDKLEDVNNNIFFRWQPKTSAGSFPLRSMTIDRSGIIWVGTNGNGLYKLNPNKRRFHHSLIGKSVRQFAIVTNHEYSTLLYNFDWHDANSKLLGSDPLDSKNNLKISDFTLISKDGSIWNRLPSRKDNDPSIVRKFNKNTNEVKYYYINWHHYDTQPMIEANDRSIWMAGADNLITKISSSSNRVISYDLKTGENLGEGAKEKRSTTDYSTALYEDQSGSIWIGSKSGITKCNIPLLENNNIVVTKYKNIPNDNNSLNYNHVTCFLDDPFQPELYLWVSTKGGGINKLNKQTNEFTHITKKEGLPDNVVYGLMTDNEGNIWGSTNKGIFSIINDETLKSQKSNSLNIRNFSKVDGLQDEEFNTGAFAKFPDGRLAFGGINGYNIFDPKEILTTNFQANTFITRLLVNNSKVAPFDDSNILSKTIEATKQITLNHLQDIFTLEFTTLDFNAPNRNKYKYQLIGANDDWVDLGSQRSVTFVKLPPKTYTFRILGTNSQGIWNDKPTELTIHVLPPWWKSWWAYLLYLSIIGFSIWSYFQFSLKRASLQQELAFEKRESDRVRDLDGLKTKLYINMTHEFRTPLTIILGMAQQIIDNPKDNMTQGLDMIKRNGQSLLNLINKMLSLSKLENGKMELERIQGNLVLFLKKVLESLRTFTFTKDIHLHFLPEIDSIYMDFDPEKLEQIISNLVSNAYKFSPAHGNVYLSVRQENGQLIIKIKDLGKGIPAKDIEKIFDRFYQVDNSTTRHYEGTGIGLSLTKELVKLMNGEISVQSPPVGLDKGSEFTVVLPISNNAKRTELSTIFNGIVNKNSYASTQKVDMLENSKLVENINLYIDEKEGENQSNIPLILVVEDNLDVSKYIVSCLLEYKCIICHNGQEGFKKAMELVPDLIISDVMMPIMDGFTFCNQIKSNKLTEHIPIILLTARADFDSKIEGLEHGANVYLPKPFEKQELLLNIKNLFDLREKQRLYFQKSIDIIDDEKPANVHTLKIVEEDSFVKDVREMIEININNADLTVEDLTQSFHLSHSQFGRKLIALTGLTPNKFMRLIRLKNAKLLLQDKNNKITTIAYECGFNDANYFSRVFKSEFGKTPVKWREGLK
jgi:signal transduction histidine kinase/DNA-binding response OmpR family regulator